MPRKELEELQLGLLRRQLKRCFGLSGFYREKWERAGVTPDRLKTLGDLRRFPCVTKQELRDEQAARPLFGRLATAPPSDWRELHPSSGTTGFPVSTIWSAGDVQNIADITARTMWSFGVRPGDVIQNAFSYGLWVAGLAVHAAAAQIGCFVIPIGAQLTERQIFYLHHARSAVIMATPSYGVYLGEKLREEGIEPKDLGLRIGAFGGEAGVEVPSTRARLEASLDLDAYDYYGVAELGPTFASECTEKSGLHWAEDHYLIEILHPDTRKPVTDGEVGVLTVTHLTRQATPMIRYWTGDYARKISEPCRCGRSHARSPGGILGRHDDLVIYRGAKFYPTQVEKVIRSFPELPGEYQIRLVRDDSTGLDRCTVVAETTMDGDGQEALLKRLTEALKAELLVTPEVELVAPGVIERTTFKAKRVFDLRQRA